MGQHEVFLILVREGTVVIVVEIIDDLLVEFTAVQIDVKVAPAQHFGGEHMCSAFRKGSFPVPRENPVHVLLIHRTVIDLLVKKTREIADVQQDQGSRQLSRIDHPGQFLEHDDGHVLGTVYPGPKGKYRS